MARTVPLYGVPLGTGAAIYGTNYINNSTGVVDPVWQCFMDGISSGTYGPFPYSENNWVFCQWDSIPDGPHIMSVNATSKGQTFLFDVLRYSPTDGASINGGAIVFDHIDPDIYFDSQWGALEGTATMTTTMGATMTLDFFGMFLCFSSRDQEAERCIRYQFDMVCHDTSRASPRTHDGNLYR